MKKIVAILLSSGTLIICGWFIISQIGLLDILPNYTETIASSEKNEINLRTDINACEKEILIKQIDFERQKKREISNNTFKTQIIVSIVFVIQLVLLIILFIIPSKVTTKIIK